MSDTSAVLAVKSRSCLHQSVARGAADKASDQSPMYDILGRAVVITTNPITPEAAKDGEPLFAISPRPGLAEPDHACASEMQEHA